ncbi:hypothetical protein DM01DRAFT_1380809 [Hesseltinella vesiculosa]|uniref:DH domain-containing protein n=1 Tax=Hesseltinella vesiculosa TaxID=101127 RepID=A0A1X2GSV1_9FUNG|nr:hypothetical protein DM01DRAFT_1380809 [Hesseltinella vesiculosa]
MKEDTEGDTSIHATPADLLASPFDCRLPLISVLAHVFSQAIAYAHITHQEALNVITFMLSIHPIHLHEQLFTTFLHLGVLEAVPQTSYFRVAAFHTAHGIFTPITSCYSPTCLPRLPSCYAPTCPNRQHLHHSSLAKPTHSWLQQIPRHILEKSYRHELMRQAAIVDLLRMEQNYLADLKVLDTVYAPAILTTNTLTATYRISFFNLLFGNHEDIIKMHQQFCLDVLHAGQQPNQVLFHHIGKLIYAHVHQVFDTYVYYTANHIKAAYALRMERRRNHAFDQWLDTLDGSSSTRRLDLSHFLTLPTLWIGKFRMLVGAILKRTPATFTIDHAELLDCLGLLHDLLTTMNDAANQATLDTRRVHVMTTLSEALDASLWSLTCIEAHQAVFPHAAILEKDGHAGFRQQPTFTPTSVSSASLMACHVFLFDHMLFIAQPKTSTASSTKASTMLPITTLPNTSASTAGQSSQTVLPTGDPSPSLPGDTKSKPSSALPPSTATIAKSGPSHISNLMDDYVLVTKPIPLSALLFSEDLVRPMPPTTPCPVAPSEAARASAKTQPPSPDPDSQSPLIQRLSRHVSTRLSSLKKRPSFLSHASPVGPVPVSSKSTPVPHASDPVFASQKRITRNRRSYTNDPFMTMPTHLSSKFTSHKAKPAFAGCEPTRAPSSPTPSLAPDDLVSSLSSMSKKQHLLASSSKLRQRLRASMRWSSGPVYTYQQHTSTILLESLSSTGQPPLLPRRRLSVPELSNFSSSTHHPSPSLSVHHPGSATPNPGTPPRTRQTHHAFTLPSMKARPVSVYVTSPNTPLSSASETDGPLDQPQAPARHDLLHPHRHSAHLLNDIHHHISFAMSTPTASPTPSTNASRASSISDIAINSVDDLTTCQLQFCHAAWTDTTYQLTFDSPVERQEWYDTIQHLRALHHQPCTLIPLWEQPQPPPEPLDPPIDHPPLVLDLSPPTQPTMTSSCSTQRRSNNTNQRSFHRLSSVVSSLTTALPNPVSPKFTKASWSPVHCALPFETSQGEKMMALGTQNGVWIGMQQGMSGTEASHGLVRVMPIQGCHRLVLLDRTLVAMSKTTTDKCLLAAYPLDADPDRTLDSISTTSDLDDSPFKKPHQSHHRFHRLHSYQSAKKWYMVKRSGVIAMVVGNLYQQPVLIYLASYGDHVMVVVAVSKKGSGDAPQFKKVKEYLVNLKDPSQVYLHDNFIYVQSSKHGVVRMQPSRRRESRVQWESIYQGPCLRYVHLAPDHGLVVTTTSAHPVVLAMPPSTSDSSAASSVSGVAGTIHKKPLQSFDFEARIYSVSLVYPYLIAFGLTLVEVWDAEKATLLQVIHQPRLSCLCDTSLCTTEDKPPVILVGPAGKKKHGDAEQPYQIYQLDVTDTRHSPSHLYSLLES